MRKRTVFIGKECPGHTMRSCIANILSGRKKRNFHQHAANEFRALTDEEQEQGQQHSFTSLRPTSGYTARSRGVLLLQTYLSPRKTWGGTRASACGWSMSSSLLLTTARWCGFFAFKVPGRNISLVECTLLPVTLVRRAARSGTRWGQALRNGIGRHSKGRSDTPAPVPPWFSTAQTQSMPKPCKTCCVDVNWKENTPFTLC